MTDRLSQLLHEEAGHLAPPPPDPAAVLEQGRRMRRRDRLTTGLAGLAVAAVVVTTAGFVALGGDATDARDVAPAAPGQAGTAPPAYGVGSQVHLGDVVATVPDTVHSLHYTSLGVLVRSNPRNGASDGSGPESLTLVRWDGSTTDLGTVPEGVGPATDPDQDVYVLAEERDGAMTAVVREVATGHVRTIVRLPDLPPSYWDVTPLALDGDTLYAGFRKETVAVDLETGGATPVDGLAGGLPDVQGGRTVVNDGGAVTVRDVVTGEVLLDVEAAEYAWGTLSPDGRFLQVVIDDLEPRPVRVYDVATGEVQELPASYSWGWTADGDLFRVEGDTLSTCSADTGDCQQQPLDPPLPDDAEPRLGGRVYES